MITIGTASVSVAAGRARLSAHVELDGRTCPVWFEVDAACADCLAERCADPFVMLLLPRAMAAGEDMVCADPVTERLHYQLEHDLIPALCGGEGAKPRIDAPLFPGRKESRRAVGAFWDGGVEPSAGVTHLLTFEAAPGALPGVQTLFVRSNAQEWLGELPPEEQLFFRLAVVLALQGLFGEFLLPYREEVRSPLFPAHAAMGYHLLLTRSAGLDTLFFCLTGMEKNGPDKPRKTAPAIKIGTPCVESRDGLCRLCARVELDGRERTLWFEVGEQYGEDLVYDRADAFVVGLLPAAMARGADLVCEGPVTGRLLHRLNEYLIPTLSAHVTRWNPMKVCAAATEVKLPCKGAVATGWTAGTDSFFTLMKHLRPAQESRRLTHLLVASHGAIEGAGSTETLRRMEDNARAFAEGKELAVISVNSNVQTFDTEGFGEVGSFRSAAVGLALQKLFGAFLHSSDYAFSRFNFGKHGDGYYQILSLGYLESDTTVFYSAGGALSKTEKTRQLAEYPLAYDALHPCVYVTRSNCGRCAKCLWTEVALYVFGRLEEFRSVFDVDDFYANKELFLTALVRDKHLTSFGDLLEVMREKDLDQEFIAKTDRILQRINRAKRNQTLWLRQKQAEGRGQESEA